jgi:Ca2+-binding RTX toxin-like protein
MATPLGNEFRVNTVTTESQEQPKIATDANGNFVVTWTDRRLPPTEPGFISGDIYAQRYNSAGVAQGANFLVNTTTVNGQYDPAIAENANGDFVIAWSSGSATPFSNDGFIRAQRYNSAGVAQGSEIQVANTFIGSRPAVALNNNGDMVITWQSGSEPVGISGSLYSSSGVVKSLSFPTPLRLGSQRSSAIAIATDGSFIVTWAESKVPGPGVTSLTAINAQRFNSAGDPVGNAFQVNAVNDTDNTKGYKDPAIALGANGDFMITWDVASLDGSGTGVYARRYNSAGVAQGNEFRVNTTTTGDQTKPAIAANSDGDFVISWSSNGQDGSGEGIYAQLYNSAGVAQGSEFKVNTFTQGNQDFSSITEAANGNFTVVWQDGNATVDGQDGSKGGIYAQRFDPSTSAGSNLKIIPVGKNGQLVLGTPQPDKFASTGNFNDTIFGNNGDDSLDGANGKDLILGEGGSDSLLGGSGDDTLLGNQGNDKLEGGLGKDFLFGGQGNDTLVGVSSTSGYGANEIDTLLGDKGSDRFVIGDSTRTYYVGNGKSDYALIADFGAGDLIQKRSADSLTIGGALPQGESGTAIYLGNDLVAVVQGDIPTLASFVST